MTDEDVEAMAGGGTGALARRIAKHSPSERTGRLGDEKASPARISAAEMARIQPRGRLTKALRGRIADAVRSEEPGSTAGSQKQSPRRQPETS
jgi:hypothetical protein